MTQEVLVAIAAVLATLLGALVAIEMRMRSAKSRNVDIIYKLVERYQKDVRGSVRELWIYYRDICKEDKDTMLDGFELNGPIAEHLSTVREFYADLAQHYREKQITKRNLLERWHCNDIAIVHKVIIPLQEQQSLLMHGSKGDLTYFNVLLDLCDH